MGNTQKQNEPADKAQCPEQSTVPKNSGQIYTCTDCGLTGCRKEDGNYPPFCLTMQTESGELDEIAALYASDSIDGTIQEPRPKLRETITAERQESRRRCCSSRPSGQNAWELQPVQA